MSLVYKPVDAVSFFVTLTDEAGNNSVKQFVVDPASWEPATGLLADLWTIRDALLVDLNPVTDASITNVATSIIQVEDTDLLGASGSEIENIASLSINLSTAGKFAVLQIPAPNIGIFADTSGPDKNIVDTADALLNAYIDNWVSGVGDYTLSDGEKAHATDPLRSGKRIHRRSTRG